MDARYRLGFKKRREGKTNYKKRYNLLLSKEPRMTIRITTKQIIVQMIEYNKKGDKTIAYATSNELKTYDWTHSTKNIPSAYLTGLLCAKRAAKKNLTSSIVDFGLHTPHKKGRLFAAVKGALDGGIKIPHDESILPDEKRITGTHLKKDSTKEFEKVKDNILKMKPTKDKKTTAKKTKTIKPKKDKKETKKDKSE